MKKPEIAEKLIAYIDERILSGEYAPESRIPSVRRMAVKFHLSYGSAMRGIDFLCAQGKLAKSAKRGIYVQNCPAQEVATAVNGRRIAFFISTRQDADCQSLWYTALLGLSQCASLNGDSVIMTPLPTDDSCNRVLEEWAEKTEGMVLFNSNDWPLRPLPRAIPAVGALWDGNLAGTLTVVNVDPLESARLAVDYFRTKNISRVVIISSPRDLFMMRGRLFGALWQAAGGESIQSNELPDAYDPANGYLFTSDQVCQRALEHATGLNLPPPTENVTLLSIDGKRLLRPDFHHFPTVAVDWRLFGHTLYHELCQRMRNLGEPVKNINICGKIVE